ncbi:AraC family transcriptional regulator [Spiroplasma culicicola]|uniref:AraC family transcriptional regulator n=1 Tax=Spiroplasma culicicola AES-1 TaxID=1276246 RepID=W6AGV2_9MOLU|nr:AraC family transcriptional regulator [Spiroplasma culicicola]AHI52919.1 AraC family transcriptional regulator [Spiroplasma culicicola AES-1]
MRKITDKEYKEITVKNTNSIDVFYFGNINTKIMCLSTCDSKRPLQKNCVVFETAEQGFEHKYRPCKRCQHIKYKRNYTSNWKEELKNYIEDNFYYDLNLDELSQQIGISKFHLVRSFKQLYNITPIDFLIKTRLQIANDIILKDKKTITDVALEVGFNSYYHFSKSYKKYFNQSPTLSRQNLK